MKFYLSQHSEFPLLSILLPKCYTLYGPESMTFVTSAGRLRPCATVNE